MVHQLPPFLARATSKAFRPLFANCLTPRQPACPRVDVLCFVPHAAPILCPRQVVDPAIALHSQHTDSHTGTARVDEAARRGLKAARIPHLSVQGPASPHQPGPCRRLSVARRATKVSMSPARNVATSSFWGLGLGLDEARAWSKTRAWNRFARLGCARCRTISGTEIHVSTICGTDWSLAHLCFHLSSFHALVTNGDRYHVTPQK